MRLPAAVLCAVVSALCCHHVPASFSACSRPRCARSVTPLGRCGLFALRGGGEPCSSLVCPPPSGNFPREGEQGGGAGDHRLRMCDVLRHNPLKDNDELFGISLKVTSSAAPRARHAACLESRCNVPTYDIALCDGFTWRQVCVCVCAHNCAPLHVLTTHAACKTQRAHAWQRFEGRIAGPRCCG
jgi:hypothetical protein